MNAVETFSKHLAESRNRCALVLPDGQCVSFEDLGVHASAIQQQLWQNGVRPGDRALLLLSLGAELFATVLALMAMGCPILFIEPWLAVEKVEKVIRETSPAVFLTSCLGRIWALRVPAVRKIPVILSPSKKVGHSQRKGFHVESVDSSHLGILTFTSGTSSSAPKGVMRSHGYLLNQLQVFRHHLHPSSVDWCIFANFVLGNLASGITSILGGSDWSPSILSKVAAFESHLQPRSLTCSPSFLERLIQSSFTFPSLESVHVGGALADCDLLERAFMRFPKTRFTQVYGSTEAEPVALMDAREAVRKSKLAGRLQTLALGRPVPELTLQHDQSGLWVSGPHVSPSYWGDCPENELAKRRDSRGGSWHCMGDRVSVDSEGILWYSGRSFQRLDDFDSEQKAYSILGHTRAFVHRDSRDRLWIFGEGVVAREKQLRSTLPLVYGIEDLTIIRDSRHRSRIERMKSIKKGAPWFTDHTG